MPSLQLFFWKKFKIQALRLNTVRDGLNGGECVQYEYYIKSIPTKSVREGQVLEEDYAQYIMDFTAQGWRFVQLVNLVNLAPNNRRIDLIFERKQQQGGDGK